MKTAMAPTEVALQNILVATDFSSTSQKALHYAAAIATRYNSKIHLVHVFNPADAGFLTPETITWGLLRSLRSSARGRP